MVSFKVDLENEFIYNASRILLDINGFLSSFDLGGRMVFSNDNRFHSGLRQYYFGYYFYADQGWLEYKFNNLHIKLGKFVDDDMVDSPYSLFINSRKLSFVGARIEYEDDRFFYITRWMQLTKRTEINNPLYSYSFPDRGANFKAIGFKLGKFRVGYEEASVYVGRTFDFEYFASIIPTFLIQYTNFEGKPYIQGTNDNSIMGGFLTYEGKDFHIYSQILIDDINVNRFMYPESYQNPDKIAWAFGGTSNIGEFVQIYFHHAGSTKYTFEPTIPNEQYGYVRFPVSLYPSDSATKILYPEDNYIGFKYGENTLAFMLGLRFKLFGTLLNIEGEEVYSGNKSYNNPWQEIKDYPNGTHLLDDTLINETKTIRISCSKRFQLTTIYLNFLYSHVLNPYTVVQATDGDGELIMPRKGVETIIRFVIGIKTGMRVF